MSCNTPVDKVVETSDGGESLHTVENGNAAVSDGKAAEAYGADPDAMCYATDSADDVVVLGEYNAGSAARGSKLVHA